MQSFSFFVYMLVNIEYYFHMNDLQKKQLEIFVKFIELCEKNNLNYFLIGGSALGAIRHKGFIPWDDDLDVGMLREDFEKFCELQPQLEGTNYFIQTYKSDPNYIYSFAKLRDSSTTFIENFYKYHRINHGVWIDIMPIDGITDKDIPREKCMGRMKRFFAQINLSYLGALKRKVHKETWFKDILLNIVAYPFSLFNINHYRQKRMEKMAKKYPFDKATLAGNYHFAWSGKVEGLPPKLYTETIDVPFENITAKVVKEYDKYLTCLYGDYMTPPPADKQEGHHHYSGLDLNKPYDQYIKEHKI